MRTARTSTRHAAMRSCSRSRVQQRARAPRASACSFVAARAASGPAEGAGVRAGDELIGVNGEYFRKRTTLDDAVAMVAEASRVALLLRRGPGSSGAQPPGAPRPAGEAEEVRAEAARAKAEAARLTAEEERTRSTS